MTINFGIKFITITVVGIFYELVSSSYIPPVNVLILVESLCPDCQDYFKDQIEPSLQLLQDVTMVNLTIVPFGNAEIDTISQAVICQHDVGECDANSYEQCIISLYPKPSQYLPMLSCVESKFQPGRMDKKFDPPIIFSDCASAQGLDFTLIKGCHDNPVISWELQLEASKVTPSYHTGVPWVEINGFHIDEGSIMLSEEICNAYINSGGYSTLCPLFKRMDDLTAIAL